MGIKKKNYLEINLTFSNVLKSNRFIKISYEAKKRTRLDSIKSEVFKNTPGLNSKLNRSTSVRLRDESVLDISDRLNEYKKKKSEKMRRIVTKMNEVIYFK
jgi:hypothetical protein